MSNAFNVSQFLDSLKVGGLHLRVLWICGMLSAVAGFDAQSIGYVAPALISSWRLNPADLGPAFSAGLLGLMLGAMFIAPLADRIGRKPVLLLCALVLGVSSILTAFAPNLTLLTALRFITGLGLGGAMPNVVALTSEYMPARRRAFLVVMMFNGFNIGSMIGGILSAQFVDSIGWPAVFVVGGVLPLMLAPFIYLQLPESLVFLIHSNAPRVRIVQLLQRLGALPIDTTAQLSVGVMQPRGAVSIGRLFSDGRGMLTLLLWIIIFMSLLDIYLLVSWLPTALNAAGAAVGTAITAGIMLQLGSVIGCFPIGWAFGRYGAGVALTTAYLFGAACIAAIGMVTHSIPLTFAVTFGAGFGLIGGQSAANALAAMSYPPELRSKGVGWSLGVGSVGSIIGPVIGSALIAAQVSIRNVFFISAVPALLAALALVALSVINVRARQAVR